MPRITYDSYYVLDFFYVLNTLMLYGKFPPKIMPLVTTERI